MTSILRLRTEIVGPQGSPYVSTQYFTGSTDSEASDAADAVAAFFGSLDAKWPNTYSWNVLPFVDVINDATGALVAVVNTGGGNSGTGAASDDLAPFATQGLLQLSTGTVVGGRLLRGRVFLPGVTEFDTAAGKPTSSYVTAVNTAYSALVGVLPNTLRVWSRKHGTSALVTAASAWSQWAVLRSRRD